MTHYHDPADLANVRQLKDLAPEEFDAWIKLDRIVSREGGAIPRKYRELIAIAAAHITQCSYCIDVHVRKAKKLGITKQEIAEAVLLAAAMRAGAAAAHGGLALRLYDQAQ